MQSFFRAGMGELTDIAGLTAALMAALETTDADGALVALVDLPGKITPLESSEPPHPVIGVAAMLIAGALFRTGRAAAVEDFIIRCSDALSQTGRRGQGDWRMVTPFHCLH